MGDAVLGGRGFGENFLKKVFPIPLSKTFTEGVLPTHPRARDIARPFFMLCVVKVVRAVQTLSLRRDLGTRCRSFARGDVCALFYILLP